jgi:pimeloyl-ACP methyl ester carboxylesterase
MSVRRLVLSLHQHAQTLTLRDGRALCWADWGDPDGAPVLYFHGTPGSRTQGARFDEAARAAGVRLIAPDRPGYGRSTFQPNRRIPGWSSDIEQLTDHLGIDRFAVFGASGGGPYALACAQAMPGHVIAVAVAASPCPPETDLLAQLPRKLRSLVTIVARTTVPLRVVLSVIAFQAMRNPFRVLDWGLRSLPATDRAIVTASRTRAVAAVDMRESLRDGGRATAADGQLLCRPWGFDQRDIDAPVHVWHGTADPFVPVEMGRYLANTIPGCQAAFFDGEGHFFMVPRAEQILASLLR